MTEVIEVRRSIGDPVTSDFIVVEELPEEAQENITYTTGDGVYQYFFDGQWKLHYLKFSDNYIEQLINQRGKLRASIKLIDNLVARIDPTDYLTGSNAGGQSVNFPPLSEVMSYYNGLRDTLLAEEAEEQRMNSGLMLETVRKPVGGVLEHE